MYKLTTVDVGDLVETSKNELYLVTQKRKISKELIRVIENNKTWCGKIHYEYIAYRLYPDIDNDYISDWFFVWWDDNEPVQYSKIVA